MGLAGRVREVNNTFYRLPEARTFASWAARAPAGFVFAVKASRFLTHMPVLYQLPPGWKLDLTRLEHFVQALPRRALHVLEFRDPSWHTEDVLKLLGRHRVALCLHDMRGSAPGRQRVGPFVYVRFHGATSKYGGAYSVERLRPWAEWLHGQRMEGVDVYAYFNNDIGGHAQRDARTLATCLDELHQERV